MDPIFPLVIISAIAGAATLGWCVTRLRRRDGDVRVAWKIVCYRCERIDRRPVPGCEECRSTRMRPLTKYQAEGGGTGFWPDPDGLVVSSLVEGQWKPSDDESDFPHGRRHAPIFDFDFPAAWMSLGRGGQLVVHRRVGLPEYLALLELMERLGLVLTGSFEDTKRTATQRHGITGYRASGSDALIQAVFRFVAPGRLVPSSTDGHFHFYLETEIDWSDYLRLMRAMAVAGLLEEEWVDMNERRKMAMLRKPGTKKAPI